MTGVYSSDIMQFVFKQSSGKVWNFYQDEKLGLCYSILTKRNTWSEPVLIQKNFYRTYFIDMDYEDCFHIIFQDMQGNIFYTMIDGGNINTVPVLKSKSPSIYEKHLYLIPGKKSVHIFFIIEYNNQNILSHQTLAKDSISNPKVLDYVVKNRHPFSAVCDKSGNMYIVYQVSDGKYTQLGFKKYIPSQKNWGEFTPITRYNGNCELPTTIIDSSDIIHICYQRQSDRQFELVYQQKMPDRNIWTTEVAIQASQNAFKDFSLVIVNKKAIIYWVRDSTIYYSSSSDSDNSFSKPMRYNFFNGRQLVNIIYKSNDPIENEKISVKNIPGNFINGYNLAFFHDSSSASSITADELRSMLLDGFKALRGSVEELQESDINLNNKLSDLMQTQQTLGRELTKYSLRLSLLENELNQLKGISKRLDGIKAAMDDFEQKYKLNDE